MKHLEMVVAAMQGMVKYVLCFAVICALQVCHSKNQLFKPRPLLPGRLVARYEYLRNCEDVPNMPTRILKAEVAEIGTGHNYVINADVINEEVIQKVDELIIQFKRCDDATLVTCQDFQTCRFKTNICGLAEMNNQLWSPIMDHITPRVKCPIQTGHYFLRNGTLDITAISKFPVPGIEKYFWRVRMETYDPKLYMCFDSGIRLY